MSRVEYTRQRVSFPPGFRLLASVGLALAVSACSPDVARFNEPMFGLTDSGSMPPMPREGMRSAPINTESGGFAEYRGGYSARETGYREGYSSSEAPRPYSYDQARAPSAAATYPQASYQPAPYQPAPTPYRAAPPQPYQAVSNTQDRQSPKPYRTLPATQAAYHPAPAASAKAPAAPSPTPAEARTSEPTAAATVTAGGGDTIEIQPGESLFGIAQRHRVSLSELMSTNGLRSPVLKPGQKIVLPPRASRATIVQARKTEPVAEAAPAPAAAVPAAAATSPPLASPPAANPAPPAPAAQSVAASDSGYTVKNGDSLYAIAVRHKVPLAELQRLNGISDPTKVKPGTVLKLPASHRTTVAAATPAPVIPKPEASPAAASGSDGTPGSKPVVINAQPAPAQTQVAAISQPATVSDAPATPPVSRPIPTQTFSIPPPETETPARAEGQDGSGAAMKLRWPVKGKIISAFGQRSDGQQNDGIKLAVPLGTEVHAAEAGVVAYAGSELKGYGNLVLLRHDNGWITAYAHNEELTVKRGDRIRRGQVIAKAGKTGAVDQPQVHFELRQGSSPVDPVPYLEKL
jgi:murein DD-endopeptidase MepM/ murein hydrolase activator NlpD